MRVRRKRSGGIAVTLEEVEAHVLGQAVQDLLVLLGGEPEASADPLAALVGLPAADASTPRDPALARLLPDAYDDQDPDASREFRRYTEADLRAGKRAHAQTLLAVLPAGGGTVVLDREQVDAWAGAVNDLRLVLGTRLEVTEDLDADDLPADDPRLPALHLYAWLGWLLESLISATPLRP